MSSINVAQLLAVCVRASLAAQHYVMLNIVKLPDVEEKLAQAHDASLETSAKHPRTLLDLSAVEKAILMDSLHQAVKIDVKSHLDYKEDEAAEDLVTTADVLVQAVLIRALSESFPALPFTVIGEEDQPSSAVAKEAETCITSYYRAITTMPYEAELYAHLQAGNYFNPSASAGVVLHADSEATMRRRLGIFIDPIDGTNCFVGGFWQAPMTLVSITLDGVPIAGIMNRFFSYPLTSNTTRAATTQPREKACVPGLSVLLNMPDFASPFIVFDGELMPSPETSGMQPQCTFDTALAVCCSSTTKEVFLQRLMTQLDPCNSVRLRGAGYKQYQLIRKMLKGRHAPHEIITPADVFVSPPSTIKKWDCCAPHAFLYAFGGDVFNQDGAPLRYPLVDADGASAASSFEIAALPKGLVAVTPYARQEVARRLGWVDE
ncbi:hypothetical protein JKF63_03999 [Porcisia hertigi]|uniref:3'(2'),5'-bisphosphate nucleotidase n=1 Tax=Porcisia hertigi TaxID=2761500 RepID=A0A836ICE8_9TRYP|nr:hypothetical protein JKF63_03999 [Porcisia hertigi]